MDTDEAEKEVPAKKPKPDAVLVSDQYWWQEWLESNSVCNHTSDWQNWTAVKHESNLSIVITELDDTKSSVTN